MPVCGAELVTIELKINYLLPVSGGKLAADGRVLRAGRNFIVVECDVTREDGALAAKSLLTFGAAPGHAMGAKATLAKPSVTQKRAKLAVAPQTGKKPKS